ncbi:MAG: TolC family protein, partial [Planctomycetes bacterium]|nr:TolC family protein [Planctomycetota bacterium]
MSWTSARGLCCAAWLLGWSSVLVSLVGGCTRSHYRRHADAESYTILAEKTELTPWDLPAGFSIQPHPESRLLHPSDLNDPLLPPAGPFLYAYQLPERNRGWRKPTESGSYESESTKEDSYQQPEAAIDGPVLLISATDESEADDQPSRQSNTWQPTRQAAFEQEPVSAETDDEPVSVDEFAVGVAGLPIQPIPDVYWQSLPPQCLSRMLEFETIRAEYRRQYRTEPADQLRDQSRKLTLEDIVEFGLLNSRQYQTQKETLYRTALALTLQRFAYATKFSAGATGADVNYTHNRAGGITVNTLGIRSTAQGDRMLATGGDLLARFTNNVVLTFGGPNGFVSDVSSDLLFDVTQSVFQRDVLLNPLVQSERNVVYAARDYARFRKTFFLQLASQYYALLRNYRQIEINAQNYFSLVRALDQAEAEVRSGVQNAPPRVQIDQVEQNMLGGRNSLISTCNNLERGLDQLKLTMGLPTEMPVNLSLAELTQLTLRDEIEVVGELIRRAVARLQQELAEQPLDRAEIVSAAIVLVDRLLDWLQLRQRLEQEITDDKPLRELGLRFQVDEARLDADRVRAELQDTKAATPPAPPIFVLQRTMDVVVARLTLAARQIELANLSGADREKISDLLKQQRALKQRADDLHERLDQALRQAKTEELKELQQDWERLLMDVEALVRSADQLIGVPAQPPAAAEQLQKTIEQANQLRKITDKLMSDAQGGLVPIDIHVDDAMVTALVQRLDLMNERGFLADDWRVIKLAADDLKSVLNLNANQSFRTKANSDRFFEFAFNDSRTQLNLSVDLPLNRQAQRNSYRQSLINYQVGLRSLTQVEDTIKFDIRNGLRTLELDKVQYEISVASAALASERVFSTRLELALGLGSVSARDFLEAQDAYQATLSQVASGRIDYIVNRAQLALDLELMMLD